MEIKTIDIVIPKSLDDLRIKHLKAFTDESFTESGLTWISIVKFIANITLVSVPQLKRCDRKDLVKIYNHLMGMFNSYKLTGKPPQEINIKGVDYVLVDPKKAPIAYHIDVEGSDFEKDPVRLACINYIPKGSSYGDLDHNENMIYPISSRYEDFKEHFKMIDYVELNAFFLLRLMRLIDQSEQMQRMETSLNKIKKVFGIGTKL